MYKLLFFRTLLKLLYLIPVKKNKAFFSSYEGGSISCNPKYIFRVLRKKYGSELVYVWEQNELSELKRSENGIIYVKHNSFRYIYHIMTAGILISNTGISPMFPLRRNQLCINTWHGAGCYKKVGVDIDETNNVEYRKRCFYTERNTNYYLSGCSEWTRVFAPAILSDASKFLPIGCPRVDILINGITEKKRNRILDKIGIKGRKIVLYAPTYRGKRDTPAEAVCPLDVKRLLKVLEERFGGEWFFAYRCHYATASQFSCIEDSIDLSGYDDMQDLLAVTDVLISDYSSSIWDYSFTGRPCFLFCYDLNDYEENRDFYMPIRDWHFPVSETNEELMAQIADFSQELFEQGMKKHHEELGSYEDGNATKRVLSLLSKVL